MRTLSIVYVCLIALPAPAKYDAAEEPKTPPSKCELAYSDELKAARAVSIQTDAKIYPIEGADVARFLAIFNAAEPKTDFKAQSILVAVNTKFAYVELFVGGCVSNAGKLAPPAFEAMMREAFGDELPNALSI